MRRGPSHDRCGTSRALEQEAIGVPVLALGLLEDYTMTAATTLTEQLRYAVQWVASCYEARANAHLGESRQQRMTGARRREGD